MSEVVFHTDVTKILSADSYLISNFCPDLGKRPISDPKAEKDFLDVVEIITNDTALQYCPAENQKGMINEACLKVRDLPDSRKGPAPERTRDIDGVTRDAEKALVFFAPHTRMKHELDLFAKWLRFQLSTPYLQDVFWRANSIEELQAALDVYKAKYQTYLDDELIKHAVSELGPRPYGHALHRLQGSSMSPAQFFIAYTFWAYIKGCRFARNLRENDIYVVHWLRKRAILEFDGAKKGDVQSIGTSVPWGGVIQELLGSLDNDTRIDGLPDALIGIRRYTIKELSKASTPRARRDFLAEGVKRFNIAMDLPENYLVAKFAAFAGGLLKDIKPGPGHFAQFLLQEVTRPISKSRASETIRYLQRTDSRIDFFIRNGVGNSANC